MKAKTVKEILDQVFNNGVDQFAPVKLGESLSPEEALASIRELIEKEKKTPPKEYPYGSCDEYRCSDRQDGFNEAIDRILELFEK